MTQPPERSTGKIVLMSCLVAVGLFAVIGILAILGTVFFMGRFEEDGYSIESSIPSEGASRREAIEFEPLEPEGGAPDLFDDLDADR